MHIQDVNMIRAIRNETITTGTRLGRDGEVFFYVSDDFGVIEVWSNQSQMMEHIEMLRGKLENMQK